MHKIKPITSNGAFSGSSDISLAYPDLDGKAWQSVPSASIWTDSRVWVFARNGVAEGYYGPIWDTWETGSWTQRPALQPIFFYHHKYYGTKMMQRYKKRDLQSIPYVIETIISD